MRNVGTATGALFIDLIGRLLLLFVSYASRACGTGASWRLEPRLGTGTLADQDEANVMVSQPVNGSPSDTLVNETVINVAALLQEDVGSRRIYGLTLGPLALAEEMVATRLDGDLTLTRLRGQVLGSFRLAGTADVECVRCLRSYEETFTTSFAEPFRQSVDVRSGAEINASDQLDPEEDDFFEISDNHEIDIQEAIRQNVLLALPMRPDCGELCPGPDTRALSLANGDDPERDVAVDGRFSALSALLDERDTPDR